MNRLRIRHASRRPIVLLEVLIAFALVALCILPLIYPHVFILRSENKFNATVELDHFVNLLYADILKKLYQNDIPWQDIENGNEIPVDAHTLESIPFKGDILFNGTYKFVKLKQKPRKPADKNGYVFSLEFTFTAKPGLFLEKDLKENNPVIIYKYQIPIERVQQ